AASDAPVVVPLTDLGVEITIPPGWRAVGDDEIVTNLRRLDARERADEVWKRRKAGGGLVLALLQTHAKNPSERINVMVQTVDRPSEADAVAMLAHEKSVLAGKFEESTVLDEPHAIG